MAKKKLFGNHKEPRCETCANGKLTADGKTVLCQRGGALPLSHSCRRYVYDPLRRVPKRRPLLGEYSAADFALDTYTEPEELIKEPASAPAATNPSEHRTLDRVFAYLNSHDTPDTDTILAILRNWDTVAENSTVKESSEQPAQEAPEPLTEEVVAHPPETLEATDDDALENSADNNESTDTQPAEDVPFTPTEETLAGTVTDEAPVEEIAQKPADIPADNTENETETTDTAEDSFTPLLEPDDSPDIFGDLARLTIRDTSRFAFRASDFEDDEDTDLFLLSEDALRNEVVLTPDNSLEDDSVLSADDMVIFAVGDQKQ